VSGVAAITNIARRHQGGNTIVTGTSSGAGSTKRSMDTSRVGCRSQDIQRPVSHSAQDTTFKEKAGTSDSKTPTSAGPAQEDSVTTHLGVQSILQRAQFDDGQSCRGDDYRFGTSNGATISTWRPAVVGAGLRTSSHEGRRSAS
jgi:hypothetical protein